MAYTFRDVRLSPFDDGPLRGFQTLLLAHLQRNPFTTARRPRFAARRRALDAEHREAPLSEDLPTTVQAVVMDIRYPAGPVSLVTTRAGCALEFGSGERITSAETSVDPWVDRLLGRGAELLPTLEAARDTALPEVDRIRIWVRSTSGLFVAEGPVERWSEDHHELALLYRLGVSVMGVLLEEAP